MSAEPTGHDPLCGLAPYAARIAAGEWDASGYIDEFGKVQYRGCDCVLIARVVERERGKADQRVADALEAAAKRVADEVPAAFAFESDPDKVIALIVAAVAAPAEGSDGA